jgi:hypothetical protein
MRRSYKINVLRRRAIKELKMIGHKSIPLASNGKQLQKCFLKGMLPTPHIMPKTDLGAFTHLKSSKAIKLLPTSPNELPKTHPIRPIDFIKAPPTPLTPIFEVHYNLHKASLS